MDVTQVLYEPPHTYGLARAKLLVKILQPIIGEPRPILISMKELENHKN